MKRNIFISLEKVIFLVFTVCLNFLFAEEVSAPEDLYLSQTMECEWKSLSGKGKTSVNDPSDPLVALAASLEHNPVKIYNWVYENIEFQDYEFSRKNSLTTFYTKKGNEWDQTSLLITLLRIAKIPARYGYSGVNNIVYCEVYASQTSYRGICHSDKKGWTALFPWHKEYEIVHKGLDLFQNGEIPDGLFEEEGSSNWDKADQFIQNYLKSEWMEEASPSASADKLKTPLQNKTTVDLFEEKLQAYLKNNYPAKSLKDLQTVKRVIKRHPSILPSSLPNGLIMELSDDIESFAEVPNSLREYYDLELIPTNEASPLLKKRIYLPQVSGKHLAYYFRVINGHGWFANFEVNGVNILKNGEWRKPASNAELYYYAKETTRWNGSRTTTAQRLGSYTQLILDMLAVSPEIINQAKNDKFLEQFPSWASTPERNMRRQAFIMANDYVLRSRQLMTRVDSLTGVQRNYGVALQPTRVYLHSGNKTYNHTSDFSAYGNIFAWNIDAVNQSGHIKKNNISYSYNSNFNVFLSKLYMYGGSFNEGRIFEDWEATYGMSTVRGHMEAYKLGIPIRTFNESDILVDSSGAVQKGKDVRDNLYHALLDADDALDALGDKYSVNAVDVIRDLLKDGGSVEIPVRAVPYRGIKLKSYTYLGPHNRAWYYGSDHGGESISDTNDAAENNDANHQVNVDSADGNGVSSNKENVKPNNQAGADDSGSLDGDPVNLITGEFYQDEKIDMAINSAGLPVSVARKYRSRLDKESIFGYGWSWNHAEKVGFVTERKTKTNENDDEEVICDVNDLTLFGTDGSSVLFRYDSEKNQAVEQGDYPRTYSYTAPPGVIKTLVKEETLLDDGNTQVFYKVTDKNHLTIEFDSSGIITQKSDANSNSLSFIYDDVTGRLVRIVNNFNAYIDFEYNNNGFVSAIVNPNGDKCHYIYDNYGKANYGYDLVEFKDLDENITRFSYLKDQKYPALNHNMSRYTMPGGDWLDFQYYYSDQVAYHKNSKGETFNFQYSIVNRYGMTWNEEGYYRKLFYNENYDVVRITTKGKTLELNSYDENHNLLSHTNGNGNTAFYTYDENRNLLTKTNPLSPVEVADSSVVRSHKWTFEYKQNYSDGSKINKPTKVTGPTIGLNWMSNSGIETFTYDDRGNLTLHQKEFYPGMILVAHKYKYDAYGRLLSDTNFFDKKIMYSYNDLPYGLRVSVTDRLGGVTSYQNYTKLGLPSKVIKADGSEDLYYYSKSGKVIKQVDALGNAKEFIYSPLGVLAAERTIDNVVTEKVFDKARDIVSGAKIAKVIVYEDKNRNWKRDAGSEPTLSVQIFAYDAVGNLIASEDANGNVTRMFYDGMGHLVERIDPLQNSEYFFYDGNGNITTYIDKNGGETKTVYDARNNKKSVTDPLGHITSFEYSPYGDITSKIDAAGLETTYTYRFPGKVYLSKVGANLPTEKQRYNEFSYDPLGRVIQVRDNEKYIAYEYDANGNRTNKTVKHCGKSSCRKAYTTSFEYDSMNRMVKKTDHDGYVSNYVYDKLGRMIVGEGTSYSYDFKGNIIRGHLTESPSAFRYHVYDKLNRRVISMQDEFAESSEHDGAPYISYEYDNVGNLTAEIDPLGNRMEFFYDALNRLTIKVAPNGLKTIIEYDKNGNMISETVDDRTNHLTLRKTYNKNGQLLTQTDVRGNVTSYKYNDCGRLDKVLSPKGFTIDTDYNEFGEVSSVKRVYTDENGSLRTVILSSTEYDSLGRPYKVTDVNGTVSETKFDILGRISQKRAIYDEVDIENMSVSRSTLDNHLNYSFDKYEGRFGSRKVVSRVYNEQTPYESTSWLDKYHNPVKQVNAQGELTTYSYRNSKYGYLGQVINYASDNETVLQRKTYENKSEFPGYITKACSTGGSYIDYSYNDIGHKVSETRDNGAKTSYEYDSVGNVLSIVDPLLNTVTYEYDKAGRKTKQTDTQGNDTVYTYDKFGNLTKVMDAEGNSTIYEYDQFNRQFKIIDALNNVTEIKYDMFDRVVETVDALDGVSETIYDDAGRVIEEIDRYGASTQYTYDGLGRAVRVVNSNGQEVRTKYDKVGNALKVIKKEDHLDNFSDFVTVAENKYDKVGRLIETTDAEGIVTTNSYDALGRVVSVTRGGIRAVTSYDDDNRQITVTRGIKVSVNNDVETEDRSEAVTVTSIMDTSGNIIEDIDEKGISSYSEFDLLNRVVSKTDANSKVKRFEYSGLNLFKEIKADNTEIRYEYDDLNRREYVYVTNSLAQEFTYDALSRVKKSVDYNLAVVGDKNETEFNYDEIGRLVSDIQNGTPVTVQYDTDKVAHQNAAYANIFTYSSGRKVVVEFNRSHQLLSQSQGASLDNLTQTASWEYYLNGAVRSASFANGITETAWYDAKDRETVRKYAKDELTLYQQNVTSFDNFGNVKQEAVDSATAGLPNWYRNFEYDALLRLKKVKDHNDDIVEEWQHDKAGNWTFTNQNGFAENWTPETGNQYAHCEYDDNGNLTKDSKHIYIYDWANRLVKAANAVSGSTLAEYEYDAQNRRVSKDLYDSAANRTTIEYVYFSSQVVEEFENDQLTLSYFYGSYVDEPVAMLDAADGNVYTFLRDRQYWVQALADENGDIVESYKYSAYGLRTVYDTAGGVINDSLYGNQYGYTGRRFDAETGLCYYRNRMYCAEQGRFLQPDPAGYVNGLNLYAYVMNSPVNWLDPYGLSAQGYYHHADGHEDPRLNGDIYYWPEGEFPPGMEPTDSYMDGIYYNREYARWDYDPDYVEKPIVVGSIGNDPTSHDFGTNNWTPLPSLPENEIELETENANIDKPISDFDSLPGFDPNFPIADATDHPGMSTDSGNGPSIDEVFEGLAGWRDFWGNAVNKHVQRMWDYYEPRSEMGIVAFTGIETLTRFVGGMPQLAGTIPVEARDTYNWSMQNGNTNVESLAIVVTLNPINPLRGSWDGISGESHSPYDYGRTLSPSERVISGAGAVLAVAGPLKATGVKGPTLSAFKKRMSRNAAVRSIRKFRNDMIKLGYDIKEINSYIKAFETPSFRYGRNWNPAKKFYRHYNKGGNAGGAWIHDSKYLVKATPLSRKINLALPKESQATATAWTRIPFLRKVASGRIAPQPSSFTGLPSDVITGGPMQWYLPNSPWGIRPQAFPYNKFFPIDSF